MPPPLARAWWMFHVAIVNGSPSSLLPSGRRRGAGGHRATVGNRILATSVGPGMASTTSPLTSAASSAELPPAPQWQGMNHLALVTPDMDETVRFYDGVLGMPLVAAVAAGPMRHYFFEIAPGNTVAFFEIEGSETFAKGAGSPTDRAIQLDHIAFNVADEASLVALRDRIRAAGSECTDIVDHSMIKSIYFHDNNGIALEASYWVTDPTGDGDRMLRDPNPVPAIAEANDGAIADLPRTHLA